MFNTFKTTLLLIGMAALIASCTKDKVSTSTPTSGLLTGTVQAWNDKLDGSIDASGIRVSIENSTQSTLTDAGGKYSFETLPWGTYNLSFSKTGCGTFRLFGVSHQYSNNSNFTLVPTTGFGQVATTTVTAFSVINDSINGQPGVAFDYNFGTVPTTSNKAFVRYFLDSVNTVSSNSYKAYSAVMNFSSLSNMAGFTTTELVAMGFRSGQTVYAKMYGESFKSNDYTDPASGKRVFPNVNPNTVAAVNFVIP